MLFRVLNLPTARNAQVRNFSSITPYGDWLTSKRAKDCKGASTRVNRLVERDNDAGKVAESESGYVLGMVRVVYISRGTMTDSPRQAHHSVLLGVVVCRGLP